MLRLQEVEIMTRNSRYDLFYFHTNLRITLKYGLCQNRKL
jgi:hypothetical protein